MYTKYRQIVGTVFYTEISRIDLLFTAFRVIYVCTEAEQIRLERKAVIKWNLSTMLQATTGKSS